LQSPDGLQQPFFFLFSPAASLLFDRAERADLFIEVNQVLAKLLETMKLRNLLLGLAKGYGIGKGFGNGFARHPSSEAQLRIMAGVIRLSAMARGLATTPNHGGNGTRAQITQAEELF
jgi:hypothetical protein